jgi:hypothetical protein
MRADRFVAPIAQAHAKTFADAQSQPFGMLPLGLPVIIDMGVIACDLG